MPKKLRPAVDLMAFKCRTLKVKAITVTSVRSLGHSPIDVIIMLTAVITWNTIGGVLCVLYL
jgi:hypothetical protein